MPKIYIDDREPPKIQKGAFKKWDDVEIAHLPVGDVVCPENSVAIERKDVADFCASVRPKKGQKKGRIFTQVKNMVDNFENNFVIIVGPFEKVSFNPHFRFTIAQYLGAQASISARNHVPVHWVQNTNQFFTLCNALIEKSDGEEKDLETITRSAPKDGDVITSVISSVPGVGPSKARAIKEFFDIGKVSELCYLSEEDLQKVPGIGFIQSKNIKRYF